MTNPNQTVDEITLRVTIPLDTDLETAAIVIKSALEDECGIMPELITIEWGIPISDFYSEKGQG